MITRNPIDMRRDLKRATDAQRAHLRQSMSWRALELRRKALALELALTDDSFANATFAVGAL